MKYIPITEWNEDDRPREKLLNTGAENLSDAELLAIVLGSGTRELSAVELARQILTRFKNLDGLEKASAEEISSIKGMGPAKTVSIKAVIEFAKRFSGHQPDGPVNFSRPSAVYNHFRYKLRNKTEEYFYTLLLNQKNNLISENMISKGTLTASAVHPREVLKPAIQASAASFIAVHNHPSGVTEPSPEDLEITRRLRDSADIVGIQMLDHVIIGYDTYLSMFEEYPEFR